MPRQILLFTGPWADLPLDDLATKAAEWGYAGFELCCWGDHLDVQRGLDDERYASDRLELLARSDLAVPVVAAHKVGHCVSDPIDERHRALVPDYVWGDGDPEGVNRRAAEEMTATFRMAEKLGATVVSGFTGSPIWNHVAGYPSPKPGVIADGFKRFADDWHPILDAARDCGIPFAFEVHPGQIAFDLFSAEATLDALGGREEFGFCFDPSHLHWQGVDPIAFLRRFPDRIFHVHIKDAVLTLDGKSGLLAGYWPSGDHRRGWQFRSPGRGGLDWEGIIRTLNDIDYRGALSIDWHDPGMNREFGAAEACQFVKRLDFGRK